MAREDLHFRLRIPEALKNRVEAAAEKNHRSMTAEIVSTLHEAYPPAGSLDDMRAEIADVLAEYRTDFDYRHLAKLRDLIGDVGRELESLRQTDHADED